MSSNLCIFSDFLSDILPAVAQIVRVGALAVGRDGPDVCVVAREHQLELLLIEPCKVDPPGHLLRRAEEIERGDLDIRAHVAVQQLPYQAHVLPACALQPVVAPNPQRGVIGQAAVYREIHRVESHTSENLGIAGGAVLLCGQIVSVLTGSV